MSNAASRRHPFPHQFTRSFDNTEHAQAGLIQKAADGGEFCFWHGDDV
jgi:hypothetical protein